MKEIWISFIFQKGLENKNYQEELERFLELNKIVSNFDFYQILKEIEFEPAGLLRPDYFTVKFFNVSEVILPYSANFVYLFHRPPQDKKTAAKTHLPLIWKDCKNAVLISIPVLSDKYDKWVRQAVLHEFIHACHQILLNNHIWNVEDTMDRYPGILDGLEENIDKLRPYFNIIFQKPKRIGLLEKIVDILNQLISTQKELITNIIDEPRQKEYSLSEIMKIITNKAQKYGISPFSELFKIGVAVLKAESGLNPYAINRNKKGTLDRGIAQFSNYWYKQITDEEAYNPEKAIEYFWQYFPKRPNDWVAYKSKSYLKFM